MARYIDADKLIEQGWHLERHTPEGRCITMMSLADVPKANVVEVVRCEKCRYGDVSIISKTKDGEEVGCYCNLKKVVTNIDSYCPSGRRRDT